MSRCSAAGTTTCWGFMTSSVSSFMILQFGSVPASTNHWVNDAVLHLVSTCRPAAMLMKFMLFVSEMKRFSRGDRDFMTRRMTPLQLTCTHQHWLISPVEKFECNLISGLQIVVVIVLVFNLILMLIKVIKFSFIEICSVTHKLPVVMATQQIPASCCHGNTTHHYSHRGSRYYCKKCWINKYHWLCEVRRLLSRFSQDSKVKCPDCFLLSWEFKY